MPLEIERVAEWPLGPSEDGIDTISIVCIEPELEDLPGLYVPAAVAYHRVSHTFGGGRYSEEYAKHKARNWFTFLLRHGKLRHKIAFFGVSAPVLVLRLVVREGRKGNFGAIRGMLRGLFEILRGKRVS